MKKAIEEKIKKDSEKRPASINELDYKILDASNIEIDKGDIKKISENRFA